MSATQRGHISLEDGPLEDGAVMPYLMLGEEGEGRARIVIILGAGDGLSTVHDSAGMLRWFYRQRARQTRLLLISRRDPLPPRHTVEAHADDYLYALNALGWREVVLECNSAGGVIGQQLAARHPERVRGLILASSAHRPDAQAKAVIEHWLTLVQRRARGVFTWDATVKSYRPAARLGWLAPVAHSLLGALTRPRDPERLKHLLTVLLETDNTPILPHIVCPTLIFAGQQDAILGPTLQREMAGLIPNSTLVLEPGYLHGADLESPRYRALVARFVNDLSVH